MICIGKIVKIILLLVLLFSSNQIEQNLYVIDSSKNSQVYVLGEEIGDSDDPIDGEH